MGAEWHAIWENILFEGNDFLRDFAYAQARDLEIVSLEEVAGQIQAQIKVPQNGIVEVQISLPHHSLAEWESLLGQIHLRSPEVGHSLLGSPDIGFHEVLSRLGSPLFPQGLRDVHFRVNPPSFKEPCPFSMGVLVEVGWFIETDPWVLLRLRGLSQDKAGKMMQAMEERLWQPSQHDEEMNKTDRHRRMADRTGRETGFNSNELPQESFWGNARAIRAFRAHFLIGPACPPPRITLGAPPLKNENERNSLADLLALTYGSQMQ